MSFVSILLGRGTEELGVLHKDSRRRGVLVLLRCAQVLEVKTSVEKEKNIEVVFLGV